MYDAATGAFKRSWPIAGGWGGTPWRPPCNIPPGSSESACLWPESPVRLEDVERGIAVYVLGGTVNLLRLADGRVARFENLSFPRKDIRRGERLFVEADLEPSGLFYTYVTTGVRFVPFRELRFK